MCLSIFINVLWCLGCDAPQATRQFNVHRTAHEALEADFQSQTYALQLREFIAEGSAPPSYESHPVVQRNAGRLVAPLGVYMDALPYSLVDSVLGVWVINLVTGARDVLLTIRKKRVCSCGCKGWCTYYPILL